MCFVNHGMDIPSDAHKVSISTSDWRQWPHVHLRCYNKYYNKIQYKCASSYNSWTINKLSLLFSNPTKPEFSVLLIQYSALRGLPTSIINHIRFCTINSSVLAFSSKIPVKWYFQYYKEIQLEAHTFQVC